MSKPDVKNEDIRRLLWEADGEFDMKKRAMRQWGPDLLRNVIVVFNRTGSRRCTIVLKDGEDITANIVRCEEAEQVGLVLREACQRWRGGSTKRAAIAWAEERIRELLGEELQGDLEVWIRKSGYAICRTRTRQHNRFVVDYWPGKHAPQFAGAPEETD